MQLAALSFYRDRLGFDVTFQGPPDDVFFGIVQRGAAMIILKDVGVEPVPNRMRDVGTGWARWDAYLHVPDPDALAAEFSSRGVELSGPSPTTMTGCAGSKWWTPTATCCTSVARAGESGPGLVSPAENTAATARGNPACFQRGMAVAILPVEVP